MDLTKLTILVSLILSLSIAAERLAEIIKGLIPFLNEKKDDKKIEGFRRALLLTISVLCSIGTTLLVAPVIPDDILPPTSELNGKLNLLALGFLVSGGSGFWNSILTYLVRAKDLKTVQIENNEQTVTSLLEQIGSMQNEIRANKQVLDSAKAALGI